MFPDSLFAAPRGSFGSPVLPPTVDPDASPTISVTIACQWLPYIRGALQQLLLQSTWDTDASGLELVQARVFNLIDLFQECDESVLPFSCPGDLTVSSSPYGSWAIGCSGHYSGGIGYDSDVAMCGSSWYNGVDITITLPNAINLSNVSMVYSIHPEAVETGSGLDLVFVQDLTSTPAFIGTPLVGPLPSVTFGTYNSGPSSTPVNKIRLFAASGASVTGGFVPTGAAQIGPTVRLTGTAALPPC